MLVEQFSASYHLHFFTMASTTNAALPATSTSPIGSLHPLTPTLQIGLIPVALFGFLSAASSSGLLFLLTWRIWSWNRKSRHVNQFVLLIYNLILADIQQSMAFLLNAKWLATNSISVGTSTCWAQGCKYCSYPNLPSQLVQRDTISPVSGFVCANLCHPVDTNNVT